MTTVYDGDGNRVSKTAGGVVTNYLVDTNNLTGYAQVVEEIQGGAVVKAYTYGADLISQRVAGGDVSFYGYDGSGSVRTLTNSLGNITDTYTYDAYGTLIQRTGTTANNYLYAGEQFDPDLGFYYNRARYLNVESGRFISQDSYEGSPADPQSLHKYLYTGNDPVNKIDPSGNETTLAGTLGAAVVSTIIANIAIFAFAIVSGSYHDKIDGGLLSARAGEGFGGRGITGGAGVDVIWQRSTGSLFYALTAEIGRAPLTLFNKHKVSWGISLGGIVGMTDPQKMSGAAATATFPAAVIHLLPASIVNYNKAWGAMTQLAKRATNARLRDLSLSAGISSSGPSYATFALRSNTLSTMFSYSGEYYCADPYIQDLRDIFGSILGAVENGIMSTPESLESNADTILSAVSRSDGV